MNSNNGIQKNDHAILIVDDSEDDVYFLRHALTKAGITNPIEVVHRGEEAIARLQEQQPPIGLVLLDLNMPGISGFDVLAWRAKQPPLREVPVVVLTASSLEIDQQRALKLGAADYHVKPTSVRSLTQLVRSICQRCFAAAPDFGQSG